MSFLNLFGGGDDSSSSSSSTTNTLSTWNNLATTEDNRQVLAEGAFGASGGSSLAVNQDHSTTFDMLVNDNSVRNTSSVDPGSLRAMETAMLSNTALSRDAIYQVKDGLTQAATSVADAAWRTANLSAQTTAYALDKSLGFATKNNEQLGAVYNGALDFAARADAQQGVNFNNLLGTSYDMFKTNISTFNNLVDDQFSSLASAQSGVANAYQTATAEKSGSIDNKTIMMIAIAAIAAFAFTKMR